jgi:hypothetical protein
MEAGMIRILTFALTGGMVLFAACGGSGDDDNSDATPQATFQATPAAPAVATPPWAGQQGDLKTNLGQMVLTRGIRRAR